MRTIDPTRGDRILESAGRLFHKRHYHEVRMEDVAADAGVAKGTLYRYFQDKEALYLALIVSSMNRFVADVAPLMAEPEPADQRLRAYIRRVFDFSERFPYFQDLVQRVEGTTCPERLAPLQYARQRVFHLIADVMSDLGRCDGYHVPDAFLAAIALTGMLRQILRFLPKPWPDDLPERIAEHFLHGVHPIEAPVASRATPAIGRN